MELKDFGKWARGKGKLIERRADATVRKCALAIDATVVLATPVDTGRARANWFVSLDEPSEKKFEAPSSPGTAARESINQGKVAIGAYNGNKNHEINIANNLSYIGRLNNGWSKQAPSGFVEKAILVGINAIKKAALTVDQTSEKT